MSLKVRMYLEAVMPGDGQLVTVHTCAQIYMADATTYLTDDHRQSNFNACACSLCFSSRIECKVGEHQDRDLSTLLRLLRMPRALRGAQIFQSTHRFQLSCSEASVGVL